MRVDHEIFHTPHEVELSIEERPTPKDYERSAEPLGDTMAMWRVQTEGYGDGSKQLIGLVSGYHGFLDSPDTEILSSGVNTKGPNSVAIGRHGNFLQWGFAASPTYMTDEAKLVFVNAIHYIAGFDGQAPVTRKVRGSMPRSAMRSILDSITEEAYARAVSAYEEFREEDVTRREEVQARIDAGEEVSEGDRRYLTYPTPETPGRFDNIGRFLTDELKAEIGEDQEAIHAHFEESWAYLYYSAPYLLAVDEDLQRLGLPNNELRMLDHAVAALAAEGEPSAVGLRLLRRYTEELFDSAEDWSAWLAENRDRLFFTEAGGYKWLVDRPRAKRAEPREELMPTAFDPIDAVLEVETLGEGKLALTVRVEVFPGWHTYAFAPPTSAYRPMTLALKLPDGLARVGAWERPPSRPDPKNPELRLLEGAFSFRCEVEGSAKSGEIVCKVGYQVCDERKCLPPAVDALTAALPVDS